MRSRRKLEGSNKRAAKKTAFRVEDATIAGAHRAFRAKKLTATELVNRHLERVTASASPETSMRHRTAAGRHRDRGRIAG
jgi:Asp-tRNA(Asn)/Glu-tRNA(Gln) amidotransferase A subunit family amidase